MPTIPEVENLRKINSRYEFLRSLHQQRDSKRQEWKWLRRGLDPRKMVGNRTYLRTSAASGDSGRLRTNDPITFFNTAVHLLAGRDVRWLLASKAGDSPEEKRAYGLAERWVRAMFRMNDERLVGRGGQRLIRADADTACEAGIAIHYREAGVRNGEFFMRVDPVSPKGVYERFDEEGLAEVVREITLRHEEAVQMAEAKSWAFTGVKPGVRGKKQEDTPVLLWDYWERTFSPKNEPIFRNIVKLGNDVVRDEGEKESPWAIRYFNGEAFSQDYDQDTPWSGVYTGVSILEPNAKTYLDRSDFNAKLDYHLDEVLKAPVQEFTAGGQPKADPNILDAGKPERGIQTYDSARGDVGMKTLELQQISPAIQFREQDLAGQIQRGSTSYALMGSIKGDLAGAGFAIAQLREQENALVREAAVVLASMAEDDARWAAKKFQDGGNQKVTIRGVIANSGKREFFHEEVAAGDLPENLDFVAEIELAQASDLIQRVNAARTLLPDRAIVTPRTIHETLLNDMVPDTQREVDDLLEMAVQDTEPVKIAMFAKTLKEAAIKESDPELKAAFNDIAERFLGTLKREGTQPQGEGKGIPAPETLSTETRTRRPAPQR